MKLLEKANKNLIQGTTLVFGEQNMVRMVGERESEYSGVRGRKRRHRQLFDYKRLCVIRGVVHRKTTEQLGPEGAGINKVPAYQ